MLGQARTFVPVLVKLHKAAIPAAQGHTTGYRKTATPAPASFRTAGFRKADHHLPSHTSPAADRMCCLPAEADHTEAELQPTTVGVKAE